MVMCLPSCRTIEFSISIMQAILVKILKIQVKTGLIERRKSLSYIITCKLHYCVLDFLT